MAELTFPLAIWLVTYVLHSTLLYGVAWLIDRPRLLRAPAVREHLWRAALVGALVTATLQSTGLVKRVPLSALFGARETAELDVAAVPGLAPLSATSNELAPRAHTVTALPAHATRTVALLSAPSVSTASAPTAHLAVARSSFPVRWEWLDRSSAELASRWTDWLILLWLSGASCMALRFFVLGWLARRELADRGPADSVLISEFTTLCATHHVLPPALSVAPGLAGPISLPNREIVLPPWVVERLDARQRKAMLAHELAHQVRRDPQWRIFALVLDALLWLQPLNALARRRLGHLAELEADAWAARAVDDPRALAECLAECAEHLMHDRAALFGAAMASDSPLVERVDRLMKRIPMHVQKTSWPIRISVVLALAAAVFVMPGCGLEHLVVEGRGALTRISVSNDGETSVTVKRPGYALHMESEGRATFTNDESDIATLEPDGEFELAEKLDGVEHEYKVEADRAGTLTRAYSRDGKNMPLDAAAKQWLAEALPRMFRESGLDADARVERLLAKGGPSLVLAEVDLAGSAYAKASYLGKLLATTRLDAKELERALASAAKIGSSYELRRALTQALQTQSLDGARLTALLETARKIDSDYELAELLIEAARHMPDDESAGVAWRAAMAQIGSDYELRRTIEAGLDRGDGDARFVATLLAIAAEHIDSDHELRTLLEKVARNATDTVVASAYLAAVRKLDSDFERRSALVALLENAKLDAANLVSALDATAELGSDFEKRTVLQALAASVAADPALNRRYREAARDMSDFERGEALRALDDATRP